MQSRDRDIVRVRELLTAGQRPSVKRDINAVKVFFRSDVYTTIDKFGCIVVIKQNRASLIKRDLVAVPNSMSMGLLYSLHINLGHPSTEQLHQAVDTRFFIQDIMKKSTEITDSCTLCTSVKSIPVEVHDYESNDVPEHPGQAFTVDVMRECKKLVLVAVDNFSSYVTTSFIASEKEESLRDGIIATITPFMASSLSKVRVDRAPGFAKMKNEKEVLDKLGIDLELGHAKNKNSLAIADQKIKELRSALRKVSPSANVLNQTCLSRATTIVNESIRHHKLSAKEIHFSRDLASNKPIKIKDSDISSLIKTRRESNNPASARSKSKTKKAASSANAAEGQLVFIISEGDKRSRRDLYLVLEKNTQDDTVIVCKVRDALSNKLASMAPHIERFRYLVKQTDVILAPNQPPVKKYHSVQVTDENDLNDSNLQQMEEQEQPAQLLKQPQVHRKDSEDDSEEEDLDDLWIPTIPQNHTHPGQVVIHPPPNGIPQSPPPPVQSDTQDSETNSEHDMQPDYGSDDAAYDADEEQIQDGEPELDEPSSGNEEDANTTNHDEEVETDDIEVRGAVGGQLEDNQGLNNNDAGEDEEREEAAENLEQEFLVDQSRQPVRGDVVAFVEGNYWVKARIRSKVTGYPHYYNIILEDGRQDGAYFMPPTADKVESWTLLNEEDWNDQDRENLLDEAFLLYRSHRRQHQNRKELWMIYFLGYHTILKKP